MTNARTGQVRMVDALLRTLGGRTILLHIPAPAVQGDLGEQIGLAVPEFQDVELGPVVFRRVLVGTGEKTTAATSELLVSAAAVERVVGSLAYESAALLFASAAGVLVDGSLLRIVSVVSAQAFGAVYLYRLGLVGTDAVAV